MRLTNDRDELTGCVDNDFVHFVADKLKIKPNQMKGK